MQSSSYLNYGKKDFFVGNTQKTAGLIFLQFFVFSPLFLTLFTYKHLHKHLAILRTFHNTDSGVIEIGI